MPQLARATASLRRPGLTWTGRCTARVSVSELRAQLSGEKPHDNGKSDEDLYNLYGSPQVIHYPERRPHRSHTAGEAC